MIELDTNYWYCQEDGGQFNIKVTAIYSTYQGKEHITMIGGKGLITPCIIDGVGFMVVKTSTLFTKPQDPQP